MQRRAAVLGTMVIGLAIAGCGGGSASTEVAGSPGPHRPQANPSSQRQVSKKPKAEGRDQQLRRRRKREARLAEKQRVAKKRRAREAHDRKKEEAAASTGVAPITAEEFHSFKGVDLGNWEIVYGICAVTPEKQLANEFHTEQNIGAIGHAYGSGYREPFNIAAEEGCMAALIDSHPEREAAFKLMEENE